MDEQFKLIHEQIKVLDELFEENFKLIDEQFKQMDRHFMIFGGLMIALFCASHAPLFRSCSDEWRAKKSDGRIE